MGSNLISEEVIDTLAKDVVTVHRGVYLVRISGTKEGKRYDIIRGNKKSDDFAMEMYSKYAALLVRCRCAEAVLYERGGQKDYEKIFTEVMPLVIEAADKIETKQAKKE